MSGGDGYALDLVTPVRHVATELDGAAPAALSFVQLAATYQHPVPADLSRIKQHEGAKTDGEAVEFLIRRAVNALGGQVEPSEDGLRLAKPFDSLRYKRAKIVRLVSEDARDEQRALRAVYADLREDRVFYVTVGTKERRYTLHPLAKAIPQVSEKEFLKLAADVKAHGVKVPIVVLNGQVLDGRHRLAVASALKVPVRVEEFKGTEEQARDHVVSLNVVRRHLTIAQRGLIVRELFLPEAKAEADQRMRSTLKQNKTWPTASAEVRERTDSAKAVEIAAKRANGLANIRTIETMAPVDNAPKTQERIRSGEIKSAAEARREALKETGEADTEIPTQGISRSARHALGHALRYVKFARDKLEDGELGNVTPEQLLGRVGEIREQLDRVQVLIKRHNVE